MKQKIFIVALCGVMLIGAGISKSAEASVSDAKAAINSVTTTKDLESLITYIKERIQTLKKTDKKQNLIIDSITLSHPDGIGSGTSISVANQEVTVKVKNNEFGDPKKIVGKFEYVMYLYDVTNGSKKKILKAATGVADVPYANGTTEFSASIEGGMPYNGTDMEKEYMVEVQIDPKNKVKESNDKDNKEQSDSWPVSYTKG